VIILAFLPEIPRSEAISGKQKWNFVDLDQGRNNRCCIFGTRMCVKDKHVKTQSEERVRVEIRDKKMKERREKERRDIKLVSPLVVVDMKGRSRSVDRRRIPDRRLNNIRVEFIPLDVFYNSSID
jgi:hypothetical protein